MKRRFFAIALVLSLLATGLMMTVAHAQSSTVVVTELDIVRAAENTTPTNNWMLYTRSGNETGEISDGPGTPPVGAASLHLETPTGGDKVFLFNYDHVGTPLSDIDAISYATYRTAGSGFQVPALNIQVDFNGDEAGGFTTLVYEPVYNTNQGTVTNGIWQTWNASNGVWWSTAAINGQCSGAAVACMRTFSEIAANNPDAYIVGGFGINQGSGNAGLIAAADALTIGVNGTTTVYDFDFPTSEQILDNLQETTAEVVDNVKVERSLLASLNNVERFMDTRPQVARLALLQYIVQVQVYRFLGVIDSDDAAYLIQQAQEIGASL